MKEDLGLTYRIKALDYQITTHHNKLEIEASIFFLSILACWSVPFLWLRCFALLYSAYLFLNSCTKGREGKQAFSSIIKDIEELLSDDSVNQETKGEYLASIRGLGTKNDIKNIRSLFSTTPNYIVTFVFWVISFCYAFLPLFW